MADAQRKLVLMLAPFAPYLAHELWEMLGETSDLLRAPWPQYDPALAKEDEVEIAIQVNGKIRSRIVVPADAEEAQVRETRACRREGQSRHRRQRDREGAGGQGSAGKYRGEVEVNLIARRGCRDCCDGTPGQSKHHDLRNGREADRNF